MSRPGRSSASPTRAPAEGGVQPWGGSVGAKGTLQPSPALLVPLCPPPTRSGPAEPQPPAMRLPALVSRFPEQDGPSPRAAPGLLLVQWGERGYPGEPLPLPRGEGDGQGASKEGPGAQGAGGLGLVQSPSASLA